MTIDDDDIVLVEVEPFDAEMARWHAEHVQAPVSATRTAQPADPPRTDDESGHEEMAVWHAVIVKRSKPNRDR